MYLQTTSLTIWLSTILKGIDIFEIEGPTQHLCLPSVHRFRQGATLSQGQEASGQMNMKKAGVEWSAVFTRQVE